MQPIEYKSLSANDVAAHRSQLIQIMQSILEANITQDYPHTLAAQYVDSMPGFIEDKSAIINGAFCGDVLVGFLWGYVTHIFNETRIHSYMGGVDPDYRGHKIAQTLMEMQFEEAKRRGIYLVEAMVTPANEAAYKYHEKTGFVIERIKMLKTISE